ncbi:hypothetical protein Hanom_Chr10g00876581 [Helianthus anomalus]
MLKSAIFPIPNPPFNLDFNMTFHFTHLILLELPLLPQTKSLLIPSIFRITLFGAEKRDR